MLLRQLHRPLLRSVTATWRPATASPALFFHHGESRRNESSKDDKENNHQDGDSSSAAPPEPKPSLFEQLFPDEVKKLRAKIKPGSDADDVPRNAWVSQLFNDEDSEPPRLALPEDLLINEDNLSAQDISELYSPANRAKGMLVLGAASKSLAESDFLRLGMKGKHVEGWVGGIVKVIQARDPDTLEPKGDYFILFDTHEAAVAYKDRLEQLWNLGKAYVPAAHHGRWNRLQQGPLPVGLRRTAAGEDVATLVRSSTLVPPSQRLRVQLSRAPPARIAQLYLEGNSVDQLAAAAGSKFLVLIRLDGGRLDLDTLRRAIEDDNVRRNLAWRITDLENGILPFGKSIIKAKDKVQLDSTKEPLVNNEFFTQGVNYEDGDSKSGNDPESAVNAIQMAEDDDRKHRQYPRFIIPFTDKEETHRFVLNWHRRELKLRMGGGDKDQLSWEESRIINATVLW